MSETLYPTYGDPRTLASIKGRTDWLLLDPEFARRCEAIMIACKGALGFGGGGRTTGQQRQLFLSRHHVDPRGSTSFEGKRWTLNPGVASAAPPGFSYHEPTTAAGRALAVDFTGQVSLLAELGAGFGLVEFSNVNNEPWHAQPIEIPHSRSQYSTRYEPLTPWAATGGTPNPSEEDEPMQLIQVPGDAAIFLRDGLTCVWMGAHVDEAAIAGGFVAAAPASGIPRLALKALELRGALPDNNVTVAADFAKHTP